MAEFKRLVLVPAREPGGRPRRAEGNVEFGRLLGITVQAVRPCGIGGCRPCGPLSPLGALRPPPGVCLHRQPVPHDPTRGAEPQLRDDRNRPPRPSTEAPVAWVEEVAALTRARRDPLVRRLRRRSTTRSASELVDAGTFAPLDRAKRPNTYLGRSDPSDVARVEDRTFICSRARGRRRARPTTGWTRPRCAAPSTGCSTAACAGRTMYVVPFSMGPLGSPIAHIGVEITDSPYVARQHAHHDPHGPGGARRARRRRRVRALPALGRRAAGRRASRTSPWPCNPEQKYIVHFPETREIWSYGRGYGGNALLGKKCFALRIASVHGARRGLARRAHADPRADIARGRGKTYVAAAFPRACGKTNFAMLIPPSARGLEGRRRSATTSPGSSRRRRPALRDQPGGGLLRRRPGHDRTRPNPNAMAHDRDEHDLHQRRADRRRRRLVGGHDRRRRPRTLIDWRGQRLDAGLADARPRTPTSRFTAPASQCPSIDPRVGEPARACRSARSSSAAGAPRVVPLVYQAFNWSHGVFIGATMGSETTAAAAGTVGDAAPRPDGDAAVLRLPHGRLLQPLAARSAAPTAEAAAHLPRQLVPQGRRRQVPLARLRREHARAEVDRRPLRGHGRRPRRRRSG